MSRERSFWGWGWADESADPELVAALAPALSSLLGMSELRLQSPPRLQEIALASPRFAVKPSLLPLVSSSAYDRAAHTYGKSYRDLVRALGRDFSHAPDCVAFPSSEAELIALLDFCCEARVAAIPYGGGSSVCGGVEADVGDAFRGTLSIDMTRMQRVLEIDRQSRSARIQAGALGPVLEEQLRVHGYSLRHYPQSFEFSTLGGWLATRSGGHFATLYTHIDELTQSLRVVTPNGSLETRRLPGSGAGPSPERLFLGSEGTLGVITEAWMRIFERPRFRASLTALFPDFLSGARAARKLAQTGLYPANCRLLDPLEAMLNGAAAGDRAVLLVGFESDDHALDPWLARARECCLDLGAEVPESGMRVRADGEQARSAAGDAWRQAFLRAPYLRDALVQRGAFVETFETAVTWSRFEELHARVTRAAQEAAGADGKRCLVSCRLTHVYPDGSAPYFTVLAPAQLGAELSQWQSIKDAITHAMLASGGTTTHHHAVGRDFRKYYTEECPPLFGEVLRAAKRTLDPANIMNPGALLAPNP
jgi:alkyldihydroxyacetonephosphate synthase